MYRKGQADFNAVYEAALPARETNRSIVVGQAFGDEADALQLFDDVILKLVDASNVTDFERALNVRLRRRRIDLLRKTKVRRMRQRSLDEMVDVKDDEGAATPEILRSDYNLEEEVFLKKEADHRQVIDFLKTDLGSVDPVTTRIVTEFPQYPSITALSKALGLHHEDIKRRLRRLSRRYDSNRFGDYRDYLAV